LSVEPIVSSLTIRTFSSRILFISGIPVPEAFCSTSTTIPLIMASIGIEKPKLVAFK